MALPDGFLDEIRTRVTLSTIVGRKVTWDMRKSNQGRGDWWAPCPFHQEKSASFHVDDKKGFYYCFGCHAKGDVLTFVKDSDNLGFMEAVEVLAREAGMQMPARDPKAAEKADRRTQLAAVMEEAVKWFRRAAEQGVAQAQFSLGVRYLDGLGVPKDEVQAAAWLILAAANGVPAAPKMRDLARSRISKEQLAEAQALATEWSQKYRRK